MHPPLAIPAYEPNAPIEGGDVTMFPRVSAISFGIFFLGFMHSATACTKSPGADRPKLEHVLLTDYPVFIGTIVDSSGPTTKLIVGPPPREVTLPRPGSVVKIKVEIQIRGEAGKIWEVLNGHPGECSNVLEVGQRWFFIGTHFGSGGSTLLVDQFGNVRLAGVDEVNHEEIFKMFPEALKLPSPSIVVQDYLKEK